MSSMHAQTAYASTVSQTITEDHRELEKLYSEIIGSKDIDHQTRFGNQFVWELARHSVAEELIVYPAMEKYMGVEGKQHAEKDREQHHKVDYLHCSRMSTALLMQNRLRKCSKSSRT
jgi:hemerythrin superfamily protein